ncbi:hypothetical protein PsYK624_041230 [Phanerochaete sordida]|uniref:Uncharacterized protein n=1 Tax=Phanerochaete sordida TaxID=48140 RepID=A0A9P3G563_9APHY|nr:hypothetical protein PsYK624_041230 [Phanerochaete sordida]
MKSTLFVLLALAGPALATSYHTASPPDTLDAFYPNDVVPLGQNVTIGVGAPGGDSLGPALLTFNTTVSVRVPNGTELVLGGPFSSGGCVTPVRVAAAASSSVVPPFGLTFDTTRINQTGTYIATWNQTYGTIPDVSEANATKCDASKVSYQSWIFTANFTVVHPSPGAPTPALTDRVFTLSPAPTGKILVENGAHAVALSLAMVFGTIGVVVLRLL